MKVHKLFILPHAGGTAHFYEGLKRELEPIFKVYCMDYPGHGLRVDEELLITIKDLAADMTEQVTKFLKKGDTFCLFGHSMGTMVLYEMVGKLRTQYDFIPAHIFMSGRFPPHVPEKLSICNKPDETFLKEISRFGGLPDVMMKNKMLIDFIMPILRADYKCVEEYDISEHDVWDIDISVLFGTGDFEVNEDEYDLWKEYSSKNCSFYPFNSGHFFLNDFTKEVCSLITETLSYDKEVIMEKTITKFKSFSEVLLKYWESNKRLTFISNKEILEFSFHEIFEYSYRILGKLQKKGVCEKEELIVVAENNKDFLCTFIACILGGIRMVPITFDYREDNIKKMINTAKVLTAPTLLCSEKYKSYIMKLYDQKHYPDYLQGKYIPIEGLYSESLPGELYEASPEDIVYIQFTSGSTGDPKGVTVTHQALVDNLLEWQN